MKKIFVGHFVIQFVNFYYITIQIIVKLHARVIADCILFFHLLPKISSAKLFSFTNPFNFFFAIDLI